MDIPITLSSNNSTSGPSHDFSTTFIPALNLDKNRDYFLGLNKIEMSYSWLNIADLYNNTKIKYSADEGTTWTTITFPKGNYTYQDLEDYINLRIKKNGDNSKDNEYYVKLTLNLTILRVVIFLRDKFQLDLREGDFYKLIGADNTKIITASVSNPLTPDITNSVDAILVNCSLVSESILFGISANALELISVSGLPLSYPFSFEPRRILFNKINTNTINNIRIYITDTQLRPLD